MRIYTFSEARQRLASLLDQAWREGRVQIRRRDGQVFEVRPSRASGSPLDVPGVSAAVSTEEIVAAVRASRSGIRLISARPGPNRRLQPTKPRERVRRK